MTNGTNHTDLKAMRVLAIIPAYNEDKAISHAIWSIKGLAQGIDILVVNDGSTDATGIQAQKTAQALVVNLPANLGIGGGRADGIQVCP